MLTVDQHLSDMKGGTQVTHPYKLELGKWNNANYEMFSAFKDSQEVDVLLLKGECPNTGDATSK
jgi:hypothetical protein